MGRLLLVCRLAVKDIRHRPGQAMLLLLAIATGAATLTLGLAIQGYDEQPVRQDPGGDQRAGRGSRGHAGPWTGRAHASGCGRARAPRARLGRGRAQRAVPGDVDAASGGPHDRGR